MHAFIACRLDYCHDPLAGLLKKKTTFQSPIISIFMRELLQSLLQNLAAQVLTKTREWGSQSCPSKLRHAPRGAGDRTTEGFSYCALLLI